MQRLLAMPSRTLPVPQPDVGTLLAPHFPCQSSQADIFIFFIFVFCERTCLQTNQAAVFSCRCLSAADNSGFCLPTGNQPSAHHRHLPAPRGRFTWPNPRPARGRMAGHGNVPSWSPGMFRAGRLERHKAGISVPLEGVNAQGLQRALWEWFERRARALL